MVIQLLNKVVPEEEIDHSMFCIGIDDFKICRCLYRPKSVNLRINKAVFKGAIELGMMSVRR